MAPSKQVIFSLIILLVALNIADVEITQLALSTGKIAELNALFYLLPFPLLIALKFGSCLSFLPITYLLDKLRKNILWVPFILVLVLTCYSAFAMFVNIFNFVGVGA